MVRVLFNRTHVLRVLQYCLIVAVTWSPWTSQTLGAMDQSSSQESSPTMVEQAIATTTDGHQITEHGDEIHLSCQLQALHGRLTSGGLVLESVGAAAGAGELQVHVTALGRRDNVTAVDALGQVSREGNVAVLTRPRLREEIRTHSGGIRQDFLVSTKPIGVGPLALELNFSGATIDQVSSDHIDLLLNGGRELVWHSLLVTDSQGDELSARFVVQQHGLTIEVDDSEAQYPIRIDPTFTDADWHSMSMGPIAGVSGEAFATAMYDGKLIVGGNFVAAGAGLVTNLAVWNRADWQDFNGGTNGPVYDLLVSGNKLYVAGDFTQAGGTTVSHLAVWDGDAGAWSAIATALDGAVNSLTLYDGKLTFGGAFTKENDIILNHVGQWESGTFSPLGDGFDGEVHVVAGDDANNRLFAGGDFATSGLASTSNVAVWEGGPVWQGLGFGEVVGTNGPVYALEVIGATLYVGGQFSDAGGQFVSNLASAAFFDGWTWSEVGFGTNDTVRALATDGTDLYVGGDFTEVDANNEVSTPTNYFAVYQVSGLSWGMTSDIEEDYSQEGVATILVHGLDVYLGGLFFSVNSKSTASVAQINSGTWAPIGQSVGGFGFAEAAIVFQDDLYIAGSFNTVNGVSANNIVRWDGAAWHGLGTGTDGEIYSIVSDGNKIYVSGEFNNAGGMSASHIIMGWFFME